MSVDLMTGTTQPIAELKGLTALRGVAAYSVCLLHLSNYFCNHVCEAAPRFGFNGYLGVDLFFVLSGFVIALVYSRDFERLSWRKYFNYLFLRLARLYPVHVALLALYVAASFVAGTLLHLPLRVEYFHWDDLALQLLLIQSWVKDTISWNYVAWSVHIEWLAYIFAPLAYQGLSHLLTFVRGKWVIVLVCVLVLAQLACLAQLGDVKHLIAQRGILRIALEFPMGMLMFYLYSNDSRPKKGFDYVSIGLLVFAVTAMSLNAPDWVIIAGLQWLVYTLSRSHIFASSHTGFVGYVEHVLLFGGRISYSVYMSHMLVTWVIGTLLLKLGIRDQVLFCTVGIWAIITFSTVLYWAVEEPVRLILKSKSPFRTVKTVV